MPAQTDFAKAVNVLHAGAVDFIIVGAVAAILNGLGFTTYDLDVVYSRDREPRRRFEVPEFSPQIQGYRRFFPGANLW